jgi:hypothetical protein
MSLKHPEMVKFSMMLHLMVDDNPIVERFNSSTERPPEGFAEMIRRSIQKGEVPETVVPDVAGEVLAGVLTYYVIKQINSEKTILSDDLAEEIVDQLYIGLNG